MTLPLDVFDGLMEDVVHFAGGKDDKAARFAEVQRRAMERSKGTGFKWWLES